MQNSRAIAVLVLLFALSLVISAAPFRQTATDTPASLVDFDARAIDAYVNDAMRSAHIPGLALGVVRGDRIAYLKGYGAAGPDGRPVTAETPFILGSTSKSFTALAVMQLVEAGRIDLDAPVTTYLPWFRTRHTAESDKISVRHLLHHTSGLRTYEGLKGLSLNDQRGPALENGVRELSETELRQPAGRRFEYANENYSALGLIVQEVSGVSYEAYVRSAIFAPLQMHHSASALSDAGAVDMASGHRYWFGWPVAFDAPYPRRATPAGFLISSAEDMTHYVAAQLNDGRYDDRQLVSPQGIATLHASGPEIGPATSYAMGWAIHRAPGATKIWHDGDVSNFNSHLRLLPEQHLGMVVLMNVGRTGNSAAIDRLIEGIAATVSGRGPATPVGAGWTARSRVMAVAPVLIAALWAWWSYRSLRRRRQPLAPPRGANRVWRVYMPLTVELGAAGFLLMGVPAAVQTPMATIALFTPDRFTVVMTTAVLALLCAIARIYVFLRKHSSVTSDPAPRTMRAVVRREYGTPDVLTCERIERPVPGDDEVLVRVRAAAVSIGDHHVVTGKPYLIRLSPFGGLPRPKNSVPGGAMSGRVEAIGANATAFHPGDEVYGEVRSGAWAEYVVVPAARLALKPSNLTFDQAAAAPWGVVALQALRDAGALRAGQRVLINGASGGVGTWAVQIAKALGAHVTAVCSTRNVEMVRALGADVVIDYMAQDFTRGEARFDVLLDLIGNRSLADCRHVLTSRGIMVPSSGGDGNWIGPFVRIIGGLISSLFTSQKFKTFIVAPNQADLLVLKEIIEAGKAKPIIDRRYSLVEAADALRHVGAGHAQGQTVMLIDE